ncbi:MAG: response regulator transcription factor [Chitinophagaceae bacterium]|nr:response regulator transcription factor [Chitinophagaceae bacterium]
MKKFLIVDDHEIVRNGLKMVLKEFYPSCQVDEASDESQAMALLHKSEYDLAILDIHLPESDSIRLTEYISRNTKNTRVLIYSMGQESIYARRLIKAGASGYVSKNSKLTDLRNALETVLKGRIYLSQEVIEQLANDLGQPQNENPFETLSPREFEVATLLMTDRSITTISEILGIGISTAATHKARLFEKLRVKSVSELIKLAELYQKK